MLDLMLFLFQDLRYRKFLKILFFSQTRFFLDYEQHIDPILCTYCWWYQVYQTYDIDEFHPFVGVYFFCHLQYLSSNRQNTTWPGIVSQYSQYPPKSSYYNPSGILYFDRIDFGHRISTFATYWWCIDHLLSQLYQKKRFWIACQVNF